MERAGEIGEDFIQAELSAQEVVGQGLVRGPAGDDGALHQIGEGWHPPLTAPDCPAASASAVCAPPCLSGHRPGSQGTRVWQSGCRRPSTAAGWWLLPRARRTVSRRDRLALAHMVQRFSQSGLAPAMTLPGTLYQIGTRGKAAELERWPSC